MSTPLTEAELDALEAKAREVKLTCDAAPGGSWCRGDVFRAGDAHWVAVDSAGRIVLTSSSGDADRAVIDLAVAARRHMPEITDAVLALSAEVRQLRAGREPREGGGLSASTLDALDDSATEAWGSAREWGEGAPTPLEVLALLAEVRRLRAIATPSPAGTVRLFYPDGTHRDVEGGALVPIRGNISGLVRRTEFFRRGDALAIATDWDAPDSSECRSWVTVQVETFEQEAARERAARLEAERQRDEALAEVERLRCLVSETRAERVRQRVKGSVVMTELSVAAWLSAQADAADPAMPGAREVVAELRRRAAEIRTGAWRVEGDKR
jgi:hypothetical protein